MAEQLIPEREKKRLEALQEYGIDVGQSDHGLDRIVQLTASLFHAPIALVSLVEESRQVFAAHYGTDVCETDRASSFCAHALAGRDILVVPDARQDPRFATNRLVLGPPYIRFYAGCPLIAPSGYVLGTLCVIDVQPRPPLTAEQAGYLHDLAALVMDKLELHRLDLAWQESQSRFERMAGASPDAIVCVNEKAKITFWNPSAHRLFGYSGEQIVGDGIEKLVPSGTVEKLLALAADETSLSVGRTIELDIRHVSGASIPVEVSASMWRERGQASFCAVLRDISERRRNEARLYRLAHIDALTDLPNRTLFRERVEAGLSDGQGGCLMMVDLDGFKGVNDSFGHPAGDAMLVAAARRIEKALEKSDIVARMGGDEFALFIPALQDDVRAGQIADSIIDFVSQPVVLEGEPVTIGASIGISLFPQDGRTVGELLSTADLALYEAKASGKHCRRFFTPALREAALAKQAYQTEFPRALSESEWVLHYQPVMRLADNAIVGAEALLQWQHPQHGLLTSMRFMHALESSPVAARIGHWMLVSACEQLARWRRHQPDIRVSVSVLDAQFRAGDLVQRVQDCLQKGALPAAALELEITETILLRKDVQTVRVLDELYALGVSIAFANYGTGHASLDLLKRVKLNRLKIDAAFVQGMQESKVDAAIIRVILYLGHSLELAVTAEGVTTAAQCERLKRKGCEEIVGPWIGEPMIAEDFMKWLKPPA